VISKGKWIGEIESQGLSPAPPLQEKVWLNSTRLYIYVNQGKKEGIKSRGYPKMDNPFFLFWLRGG